MAGALMHRQPLPPERPSITKKFSLAYQHKNGEMDLMKFYFTVSMYDDGTPGEVFIKADKTGTLAAGALDAVAVMMSIGLQYGVPLRVLTDKIKGTRFGPAGSTKDPSIGLVTSPLDLLAKWPEQKFPEKES